MNGQRIGYIWLSHSAPSLEQQLEQIMVNKFFTDNASDKSLPLPERDALFLSVCNGDTVAIYSMDRLARSLSDLYHQVYKLTRKGVTVEFIKESLTFTSNKSPQIDLMLSIMKACAEFEQAIPCENQHEGIGQARVRGGYRGRKKLLSSEQQAELRLRATNGETKAQLAREFGISRETLYQYLKRCG
jgi:DNA invertase Pin-like site-specific DNA recombinase